MEILTTVRARTSIAVPLAAVLAGCAQHHKRSAMAAQTGLIMVVAGAGLSDSPGDSAFTRTAGSTALVVEQRVVAGATWRRVITSDGSSGWTAEMPGKILPTEVASVTTPLAMKSKGPGAPDFEESAEVLVPDRAAGVVEGASPASRPANAREMMLPVHLSLDTLPWLRLRFDGIEGYAPLTWLKLIWTTAPANYGDLDSASSDERVKITTRFFLAPIEQSVRQLAPRKSDAVFGFDKDGTQLTRKTTTISAKVPEMFLRATDRNKPAVIAVFSDGPARNLSSPAKANGLPFSWRRITRSSGAPSFEISMETAGPSGCSRS